MAARSSREAPETAMEAQTEPVVEATAVVQ